jgi:hypothetical protein
MSGQKIANKIVVPDIIRAKSKLVVDIHEDSGEYVGYKYSWFIYPISKDNVTREYINNITQKMPFLQIYSPPAGGTSPEYVTKPIADEGIPTIVYETYTYDPYDKKVSDATQFIHALDKL